MFETQLTLVGNALTAPEYRRLTDSGQVAASFRVVSHSRRFDKFNNRWIDGHSLRVRVTCWRRLAEGVVPSIKAGDPIIVVGNLYTRDWTDDQGTRRVLYELDASAIGHDLSRGTASFERTPPALGFSVIEDEEAERRIGGEDSVPEDLDPPAALHAAGFTAEPIDSDDDVSDEPDGDRDERRILVPA
ncbi:single-stranded DNA-binding protein [Allorhizocola rhizosphaerae]|uniref:single-stranded DNA-binding protein n=1 Tax=Allorhizocola rhizosphaerae TaxID=1872709 RepID=UPI000E3DA0EF|nr:single-stranded DNA-binding protein [Allorhizocola rhizosphaerae]